MAVLAYCQTEGLCEEYERQKIRKKNGLRQVSSLVGASTARWGMRGAGDLRLQHRLCLPNCLCCEKGKDGSVLFFFRFQIYSAYSLLWPKQSWGGRRDVSTSMQRRDGGKPRVHVEKGLWENQGLREEFAVNCSQTD